MTLARIHFGSRYTDYEGLNLDQVEDITRALSIPVKLLTFGGGDIPVSLFPTSAITRVELLPEHAETNGAIYAAVVRGKQ